MAKYKFSDIAINCTEKKKPEEHDKNVYIGLEHLDSQCLQVTRFGSEVAPIGEKLLMKKGDVLFGKRRAYQKKVSVAPFDGIFSAHGMVLRPKEDVIDKEYFPFFISSDYFLDAAIKISVGSLSPTINWNDLKILEFELPSLDEQKKLAKILWAAEKLKQRYLIVLIEVKKLRELRILSLIKCGNNKRLHEVCTIICGQSPDGKAYNEKQQGLPFYQGKTLFGDKYILPPNQWTSEITKTALRDDVLISVRAPVGPVNLAAEKCCIGRGLAAIRAKDDSAQQYLFNILHCLEEKNAQIGVGTTFSAITKDDLNNIVIPWAQGDELILLNNLLESIENFSKLIDSSIKTITNFNKQILTEV